MGASQHGLRPMEPRNASRDWLPNGDDLPRCVEDASEHRISEDSSTSSSPDESTGSRGQANREGLRRLAWSLLSIREDATRGDDRPATQSFAQGDRTGRLGHQTTDRYDQISDAAEVEPRSPHPESESRPSSGRSPEIDRSGHPIHSSEETPKNCFLDKTRPCGADCTAFDPYWKTQHCSILRALKVTTTPSQPMPPKVKP